MPTANGHFHEYKPLLSSTPGDVPCGVCLGFEDDPAHVSASQAALAARRSTNPQVAGRAVKCPLCGAAAGAPCFNRDSHRPLRSLHLPRLALWRRMVGAL